MSVALSSTSSCPLPDFEPEQAKLILLQSISDLHLIQNRLGTPQEQAEDCLRAQSLAHNIRNTLHVLQTLDSFNAIELPAHLKAMKPPAFGTTKRR
jgi:hypothetical protein